MHCARVFIPLVTIPLPVLAFCDGGRSVTMLPAQDHKQLLDGDQGPNTGGMGAYCPSNLLSEEELDYVCQNIIQPVIDGLRKEGITYRGVLYAGLMKTDKGIKVLEFNGRFDLLLFDILLYIAMTYSLFIGRQSDSTS